MENTCGELQHFIVMKPGNWTTGHLQYLFSSLMLIPVKINTILTKRYLSNRFRGWTDGPAVRALVILAEEPSLVLRTQMGSSQTPTAPALGRGVWPDTIF